MLAFNLDDDSHIELDAAQWTWGSSRSVISDFDSVGGTFELIEDFPLPFPAFGTAIGDFDEDGRMEFITGNNNFGYELFEWKD